MTVPEFGDLQGIHIVATEETFYNVESTLDPEMVWIGNRVPRVCHIHRLRFREVGDPNLGRVWIESSCFTEHIDSTEYPTVISLDVTTSS